MTVLFFFSSVFLFAQKQSIYSSVLQHKYIRKELYYILLGTKKKKEKKKNVMKADLTDFLHLLYALTFFLIISSTAICHKHHVHRDTRGRRAVQQAVCGPPRPSWLSQNQTVKCTLLLSINREATLTKKKKKIQW